MSFDVLLTARDTQGSIQAVRVNPEGALLSALDVSDITLDTSLDDLAGTAIAVNSGVANDGTLRVIQAVDSVVSTSVKTVDVSLETKQVSGFVDSINVASTDIAFETKQVSGFVDSVNVASTDIAFEVRQVSGFTNSVSTIPDATSGTALSNDDSAAYERATITKASAGRLYMLTGFNSCTSAQYVQVHNSATQPNEGVAPVVTIYVPGTSNFSYDTGVYGKYFSSGIVVLNSSAAATKVHAEGTAVDCWFNIQYL